MSITIAWTSRVCCESYSNDEINNNNRCVAFLRASLIRSRRGVGQQNLQDKILLSSQYHSAVMNEAFPNTIVLWWTRGSQYHSAVMNDRSLQLEPQNVEKRQPLRQLCIWSLFFLVCASADKMSMSRIIFLLILSIRFSIYLFQTLIKSKWGNAFQFWLYHWIPWKN